MRIVLRDPAGPRWLTFSNPADIVTVSEHADVLPAIRRLERRVIDESLWAVGFITYEAAGGFDPACTTLPSGALPLLAFGLFSSVEESANIDPGPGMAGPAHEWRLDTARHQYMRNVERIREQIANGNTYQVNYTIRGQASPVTDPWQLFLAIADDAPYAAFIEHDGYAIVSASPELFFRLDGDDLSSRPMKGTAARGLSAADDVRRRHDLAESTKDRAENVMIADMLRNDMGRVAEAGTVLAESLFDVEKYRTVWQATSTIKAKTKRAIADIIAALFPCASITGAPKVASMALIAELESSPRGIYTGAIGYIGPGRQSQFSVAIRTACVDRRSGEAEYGVGGGIVWDSVPAAEYAECLAKGRILRQQRPPRDVQLLETLLWECASGYFLLDGHIARLRASADYFDFDFDAAGIAAALGKLEESLHDERHRVRLLLQPDGTVKLTETPIPAPQDTVRLKLAAKPIDADNVFLYHKTTHREVYENAMRGIADCDDVLLWNRDGFITESTIANVAVRLDGQLCTPPVHCGLLPGVYREWLLRKGDLLERPISVADLENAADIILLNSVRRQYRADLQ